MLEEKHHSTAPYSHKRGLVDLHLSVPMDWCLQYVRKIHLHETLPRRRSSELFGRVWLIHLADGYTQHRLVILRRLDVDDGREEIGA